MTWWGALRAPVPHFLVGAGSKEVSVREQASSHRTRAYKEDRWKFLLVSSQLLVVCECRFAKPEEFQGRNQLFCLLLMERPRCDEAS